MNNGRELKIIMGMGLLCVITMFAFKAEKPALVKKFLISGYSQGTTYQIIYYALDSIVTQKQTDSLLTTLDRSVSLYMPTSQICRFNSSARGIVIDKHFAILVKEAMAINRATNGQVDITVKPLVEAWGFGVHKIATFPDSVQVKEILKHVGPDKIWLTGNFLHKRNAKVQIDLNGIAQGYAADLLGRLLESKGIYNYMTEIGGELRVKGRKPNGDYFRVGIESITGNDIAPSPLRKIVTPHSGAITTSGNYRKQLEAGGRQISHIIDPISGYPTQNEMISVTVWAENGITADGYDNGFMGMGLQRTLRFLAKKKNMGAYVIYKKSNGMIADTVAGTFTGL